MLNMENKEEQKPWIDYEMYKCELLWKKQAEEFWWNTIPTWSEAYLEDPETCQQHNDDMYQEIINKEEYKPLLDKNNGSLNGRLR